MTKSWLTIKNSRFVPFTFLFNVFFWTIRNFLIIFYLQFYISAILERRQVNFFRFKNLKNQKKIEKMLRLKKSLQIWIPGGLINHFQLLNSMNSTSRKSRKQQRLVLLHISGFDRKIFGLRFSIFKVSYVNQARWNRICRYFCNPRISSMFFEFFNVSKNCKGHYRVTGQAKWDLMALWKKL